MAKNQNIYPNDIIFVKQNNALNLPKDETEYLVQKRNDFDEIDKLAKWTCNRKCTDFLVFATFRF